ncbi:MAG: hypothetical protein ACRDKT_03770 [Actinomycetota bacterium]
MAAVAMIDVALTARARAATPPERRNLNIVLLRRLGYLASLP